MNAFDSFSISCVQRAFERVWICVVLYYWNVFFSALCVLCLRVRVREWDCLSTRMNFLVTRFHTVSLSHESLLCVSNSNPFLWTEFLWALEQEQEEEEVAAKTVWQTRNPWLNHDSMRPIEWMKERKTHRN